MTKYITVQVTEKVPASPEGSAPEPVGAKPCSSCGRPLSEQVLAESLRVCPDCGHHYPMSAPDRILLMADAGTWREIGGDLRPGDPLDFFDTRPYVERLAEAQMETGLSDAFLGGLCTISGRPVALGVMDFRFMGGSMGSVVGERFARLAAAAVRESVPLVVVVASGGARMQEGILSLMQMAKTVVALDGLAAAGLPFVSLLTHPTTGGVLASFATLADVIMAEPGALLCFAGPRVIEQTTRERLPDGFGRSEANLANGQLDLIVPRAESTRVLVQIIDLLKGGVRIDAESTRSHPEVLPRGGRPLARALARAKELAVTPWSRLRRRDT